MLLVRTLNWIPLEKRMARTKVTTVFNALNNIVDIPYNDLPSTVALEIHSISFSLLLGMMPTSILSTSTLVP